LKLLCGMKASVGISADISSLPTGVGGP